MAESSPRAMVPIRGECHALVASVDWSRTPPGPMASWPRSLHSYVSMILEMPTPAIIFWGPEQTQLYNDGYAVIMGPRHPKYFGASYRDCWPDTYPVIYPWMQKVLQRGEIIQVERELFTLTRHGFTEEAYFTFTFSPLRDDAGRIAGILQPVVEVTRSVLEERRAETLRALAPRPGSDTVAADAVAALGANPKDLPFVALVRLPSGAAEVEVIAEAGLGGALPGLARAHLAGVLRERGDDRPRPLADVEGWLGHAHLGPWGDPTHAAWLHPLDRVHADGLREAVVFGVSPRLALDDAYRQFLGAVVRAISSNLAVEESRRAERESLARELATRAAFEEERRQLRRVFMQAPVAIAILRGPEHVIELANPAVCRLWGRTPDQVLGRAVFEALPEIVGQGLETLLAGVLATGTPYIGRELPVRIARLEGGATELVHFNFVYEALRDVDGRVESVMVVATDVTDQVRARKQVEALAADLRTSEQLLRERAEFERHLIGIVSHDLRGPLSAILVQTQLALRREDLDERPLKTIQRIHASGERAVRMVQDLLDFTQARVGGGIPIEARWINLRDVVERVVHEAALTYAEREIRIEASDAWGDWDADRLAQAVSNLVVNALKYSPPGSPVTVRVRNGTGGTVEVHNEGAPIPAELRGQLFEPFHRGGATIDKVGRSVGLGLYIVDRIVRAHGGTVSVDSAEGRGTTFALHLPATAAPRSDAA